MRIEGEMTIYRAAELKSALLGAIQPETVLEIDLADVTEIDCAGVQVLMVAKQAARSASCDMRLVNHSPSVTDAIELLNLAGHFGDPLLVQSAPTA